MDKFLIYFPLVLGLLLVGIFGGIYYSGSQYNEWLDEVDSYTCANLKFVLEERDLNQYQTQEIMKRLHTPDCYSEVEQLDKFGNTERNYDNCFKFEDYPDCPEGYDYQPKESLK